MSHVESHKNSANERSLVISFGDSRIFFADSADLYIEK